MIVAACIGLAFFVLILVVRLCNRLDLINEDVEDWIAETRELKQRCDTYKELIEALSKSVRELNGVVEAAVKVKEQTSDNKPDTKALIGGWMTDGVRAEIDASHISTGMIDGKSVMNCELPNISDSDYEKICKFFEDKLTAHSEDMVLGIDVSGDVVWLDKKGHIHHSAYGD